MTKQEFANRINAYLADCPMNYVKEEDALFSELKGLKIFDEPLVGFSAATDRLYTEEFKKEGIISPDYLAPKEWLATADTVVSFFFPFTEEIRKSNRTREDKRYDPNIAIISSAEWLHGRIEGQQCIFTVMDYALELLRKEGFDAVEPQREPNWKKLNPVLSNWSERHAAYASGLGTFGLSKGLITKKGMAGRFASVITSAHFDADVRQYSDPFEYCIMCGACQRRCPAYAIDSTKGCARGKDQETCRSFVESFFLPPHGPNKVVRYGCGKCQVAVPCEHGIPIKK